jgi:hypothetical protein
LPSSQTDRTGAGYVGSLIAPTAIPIKVGCFPKTRIFFLEGLDKFFARQPVGQISQQNPGRTAAPWSGISAALMLNLFSSRSSFGNSITSPARQLTDLVMPAIDVALRRTTIGRRIASRDDVAADLDGAHSLLGEATSGASTAIGLVCNMGRCPLVSRCRKPCLRRAGVATHPLRLSPVRACLRTHVQKLRSQ